MEIFVVEDYSLRSYKVEKLQSKLSMGRQAGVVP